MARGFALLLLQTSCGGVSYAPVFLDSGEGASFELPVLASAGADRDILRGFPTHLDGHATHHPQGFAFEVEWSQLSGEPVALSNRQGLRPTFVAPLEEQELVFEISATDGRFVSRDRIHLFVRREPLRRAPRVRAGPDRYLDPGQRDEPESADVLEGLADEATGVTWQRLEVEHADLRDRSNITTPNIYALSAERDGLSSAPDYLVLYPFDAATTGDRAPVAAVETATTSVAPGAWVEIDARTSADPNGDTITYRWEQTAGPALPALPDTPTLRLQAPRRQELIGLRVFARDDLLESAPKQISIVVGAGIGGELPAVAGMDRRTRPQRTVVLDALGDAGNAPYASTHFVWEQTMGKGVVTDNQGRCITFVAPNEPSDLAFAVFAANDSIDGPRSVVRVSVVDESDNLPPLIHLAASPMTPEPGEQVLVSGEIDDPEGDRIESCEWSASVEPSGEVPLELDLECRVVEGTAEASFVAPAAGKEVTLTLTVVDELGGNEEAHLEVTSTSP
jgi:hypothetical protein